jgi:hypothetical protein
MLKVFKFRKFDISTLQSDKVVVIVGRKRTGKSSLVKDILWHNFTVPVTITSTAEKDVDFYRECIPSSCIVSTSDDYVDVSKKVADRQRSMIEKCKIEPSIDPRCILICDDSICQEAEFQKMIINNRYFRVLTIYTTQYPYPVPQIETCVDFTFILKDSSPSSQYRKMLHKNYAHVFERFLFAEFEQVLEEITNDHGVMVIANAAIGSLEDCVFWYKAIIHDPFNMS